jgi:diadenosine tetraphosphatase ApaH/serine/threonine PP2A family protein phosphatase
VEAGDTELETVYGPVGMPVAVYGHIHRPFIRAISGMSVANTGSVSLSYDGDARAAYLLLDGLTAEIRRVEYDVDAKIKGLRERRVPHADWIARMLASARLVMPEA